MGWPWPHPEACGSAGNHGPPGRSGKFAPGPAGRAAGTRTLSRQWLPGSGRERELPRAASGGAHRRGNADAGAGETRGLASTPSATLQAKLVVGAAGDAFEREAGRVADELMRRAAAGAYAPAPGADRSYDGEAPVRVSRQTAGGLENGTALPPEIAARVERMRAAASRCRRARGRCSSRSWASTSARSASTPALPPSRPRAP